MSLYIRVHVLDYKDDTQRLQRTADLLAFCKFLHIPLPKEAPVPGRNTLEVDLSSVNERRLLYILRAFWAMEALNPHFSVVIRDDEAEPEYF